MSRIKILGDNKDLSKPKRVPTNKELSEKQERYRPTGKPPLQLDKSFSPQCKGY